MISTINSTILSEDFYLNVSDSDVYSTKVMKAIENDVQAQSSYVGIPSGILLKGFELQILQKYLNEYMLNTVDFMNLRTDYIPTVFPVDFFLPALTEFLEEDAELNSYIPSSEQYDLLKVVAADTSHIIDKHIDLFQLNMFKNVGFFRQAHKILYQISRLGLPALWILLLAGSCLVLLHRKNLHIWLFYQFTSFWIFGSLLTIPVIVLEGYRLTRRIAIELPYLKYAVDMFLTNISMHLLYRGLLIFLLSSMGLILRNFKENRFYHNS